MDDTFGDTVMVEVTALQVVDPASAVGNINDHNHYAAVKFTIVNKSRSALGYSKIGTLPAPKLYLGLITTLGGVYALPPEDPAHAYVQTSAGPLLLTSQSEWKIEPGEARTGFIPVQVDEGVGPIARVNIYSPNQEIMAAWQV